MRLPACWLAAFRPFDSLAFTLAGWRKTTLCSRCFMPSTNAPILAWKVRLCSPCIAASILNKSALLDDDTRDA